LFLVVLGSTDNGITVGAVKLLKLDMNNMTCEEIEDLKDTVLSVELNFGSPTFYSPAIASSEFGGYIQILAHNKKIIYSYHVKDKTISFSSIPCVARTNHVSVWAMLECNRLESDRVLVGCKQEKGGHKEDEIVVRSVKGNSQLLNFQNSLLKEFCAGVECLKLSPLPYVGKSKWRCDDMRECCLSAPPEDPNSVLLLNRTAKNNFVFCRLGIDSSCRDACNRQELRWTNATYANQIKILTNDDGDTLHSLTCCNGKVYAYIKLSGSRRPTLLIVEVNIMINDCESKKRSEAVITLLPILYVSPFLFTACGCLSLFLKGSSTELFLVVLGSTDNGITVGAVKLLKLDMNNMTCEEIEDLKDTVLSVELNFGSPTFYSPAIASSEFGGYIQILAHNKKIIYSYHVKDKTISFSSIPCVARTNHVSVWAMLECN
nr:hypothetical protein [Tanacetum cinerariifolium]